MLAAAPFNLLETFNAVDDAIDANADIAAEIMKAALESLGLDPDSDFWHNTATASDLDKARSTIRQFYRDWSAEGSSERDVCYDPVLETLDQYFSASESKASTKVLVPGAGLGRLLFEICRRGYTVEGNEISWHQLLGSNWALNHVPLDSSYSLYPFALDFSNVKRREQQLTTVQIPDVHVHSILGDEVANNNRMAMCASDFIVHYGNEQYKSTFDAVASVFFVDTAPNVITYIEIIRNCLKDGGIWINMGPLLWHFGDRAPRQPDEKVHPNQLSEAVGIDAPGGFELTDEELLLLIDMKGFDIEKHEMRDGSGYIQNPHSMLQNMYHCSYWIARKRSEG